MALRGEVVEMVLWHLHGHVDPALPVDPERGQFLAFVAGPLTCNGPGRLVGHSGVAERLTLGARCFAQVPGIRTDRGQTTLLAAGRRRRLVRLRHRRPDRCSAACLCRQTLWWVSHRYVHYG